MTSKEMLAFVRRFENSKNKVTLRPSPRDLEKSIDSTEARLANLEAQTSMLRFTHKA